MEDTLQGKDADIINITNSFMNSNTFVILAEQLTKAWLIDAGEYEKILIFLDNRQIEGIFLTHAHFDHIYGLNKILELNPDAKVYTNVVGRDMLLNAKKNLSRYHESDFVFGYPSQIVIVNDGDEIRLDENHIAKAIFTPGHNPSCITWLIDDMVFTGDSFIPGVKTVTNLPGGNKIQAIESEQLILKLSEGKTIYPGHNV